MTVASFLSFAHDRDDLLDRGRVSGASLTFVAWCFAVRNPGIAAASGAGGGIKERLNRSDDSLPREQKRIARRALAPAELAVPPTRLSRLSRVGGDDGGQRADAFWRSGSEAPWLVLVRWGSAALRAGVVCQQPPVGRSAQFGDPLAVTTIQSTRLPQPRAKHHSPAGTGAPLGRQAHA